MVAGEKDRLLSAAQTEQNSELRQEAVRQLGVMGAHDELWAMYQKEIVRRRQEADPPGDVRRRQRHADDRPRAAPSRTRSCAGPPCATSGVMGGKAPRRRAGRNLLGREGCGDPPPVINSLFTQGNAPRSSPGPQGAGHGDEDGDGEEAVEHGHKEAPDYMLELLKSRPA